MNPRHNKQCSSNKFPLSRIITVVVLLALVVIGLASTTFATFVSPSHTGDSGSLIAEIQSHKVNRDTKKDIAEIGAVVDNAGTKANVDLAATAKSHYSGGGYLYLDNTKSNWSKTVQMMIGHGNYTNCYSFTKLDGTNIYYLEVPQWDNWTGWGLFQGDSNWGTNYENISNRFGYANPSSSLNETYEMHDDKTYLVIGDSGDNWTLSPSEVTGGYDGLNFTMTAKAYTDTSGSGSYTNSNTGGTVKISGYKISNNGTTTSAATTDTSATITKTIARTASATFTATAKTGYKFIGWFDSTTASTALTTDTTYTVQNVSAAKTLYARFQVSGYSYTVTAGEGGTVSPTSGTGSSVDITATPDDGYEFAGWETTNGSVENVNSTTTTFTPSADGANAKANFRPNKPSAISFTALNIAANTTGTGTESNPYIAFENSGFTIKPEATDPEGATKYYTLTEPEKDSSYTTNNSFTPSLNTKGEVVQFIVYAKAEAGGFYSTDYISATAHYMVFSHLDGNKTDFTMSSSSITDLGELTLSDAKVDGVADAEKAYITQTYQVSTDNSTFSDLSGSTWTPSNVGTYYFRVKTTNTKTGEEVYSQSKMLTVTLAEVYYPITVINDNSAVPGTVKLYSNGSEITNNQILRNSKLTVSLARPDSNYYIEYLKIDDLTEQDCKNVNGNITDYVAYEGVKKGVVIHYKLALKPSVIVYRPTYAEAISFKYLQDGVEQTPEESGEYYVDYGSDITYAVTPKTGYYVSNMTGVTMGTVSSSTVTGSKSNITTNISSVTATLTPNNSVTINVGSSSDVSEGGSMTVGDSAVSFGTKIELNYGVEADVVITPPNGCYAVVSGNDISPTISNDGKVTFKVKVEGSDKVYTVKFINNPKIYMVQPQYGSIYVTSGSGDNIQYYFNGDSVNYGTELTVHTIIDNNRRVTVNGQHKPAYDSCAISKVSYKTDAGTVYSLEATAESNFSITENSTVSADITMNPYYVFSENASIGNRRIFFTDNKGWGENNVKVHYSDVSNDTDFTKNSIVMTLQYKNESDENVFYADIPLTAKYVTFYKDSSNKTNSVEVSATQNAFWNNNGTCQSWSLSYSDYVAIDRESSIQQGVTVKGSPVKFQYSSDYGDQVLSAKVVAGDAADFDFSSGVFSITPKENEKEFSLVEVTSATTSTVKYYLIRIENFEVVSFTGLRKIYNTDVINNIQLDIIVKGGVLNYAAYLFSSDNNYSNSYDEFNTGISGFKKHDTLEGYINSFFIEYQINYLSGVKFYKSEVTDAAGRKATSGVQKTLFGTNDYMGTRCLYFYNKTDLDLSKYNVRACFNDASNTNHRFVTMQRVGSTNYYRAVIPNEFESTVNFYLTNPKTFSNNFADYDGTDDVVETYTYDIPNVKIPQTDDANIVYAATEFGENGIVGEFTQFDY